MSKMYVTDAPKQQNSFRFFLDEVRLAFLHLITLMRDDTPGTKKVSMQQWLNKK